jgi:glutamate racemase
LGYYRVMKIGVFDSGVGGQAVTDAIRKALPGYDVVYANDQEHVPYGTKDPAELLGYVVPILEGLVDDGCSVIVIACNTVTTTLIDELRQRISVPLVGMEPMVKPAAEYSASGVVAVCATPATLKSKRYAELKGAHASDLKVLEPDCSDWAYMIETRQVDRDAIKKRIDESCAQGADIIVLGCTHYHWIEELITELVSGRAIVLQPEVPVIAQLKRVIDEMNAATTPSPQH